MYVIMWKSPTSVTYFKNLKVPVCKLCKFIFLYKKMLSALAWTLVALSLIGSAHQSLSLYGQCTSATPSAGHRLQKCGERLHHPGVAPGHTLRLHP